jgi:succinate-semialdehyde dehydrogenase/glutarate-semialdehyde dehydrogenase
MPLGPAFGMSDQTYANLVGRSLRLMKALRLR